MRLSQIYCITCTLCKKTYIGEPGRRLGDRFREHLRDVWKKTTKMRHNQLRAILVLLIIPTTTWQSLGLSLHHGSTESRKELEQWTSLIPLIYSQIHVSIFPPMAKLLHTLEKANNTHNSSIHSVEGLTLEGSAFQIVHGGNSTFVNKLDQTKFWCFTLPPTQHIFFFRN